MILRRVLLSTGLALCGCDQLFPELTGANNYNDFAVTVDGDVNGFIEGRVCRLTDLPAPATCTGQAANVVVTIAETRATASTNASGAFTINLSDVASRASFELSSVGTDNPGFAPTIVVVSASTLVATRSAGIVLPVVDAQALASVQLANGVSADATHGTVLAWIVDSTGSAVKSAVAARVASATGPLYDSTDGSLATGAATGSYGAIAFLDVEPGMISLQITPSTGAVGTFSLPVEGGAITAATLTLPAE